MTGVVKAATPNCDCPGNGKPGKDRHAPNCPYRTVGYESREEHLIGDSLWAWLQDGARVAQAVPDFDAVRNKRMSELTPAQKRDALELWIRDQAGFVGKEHIPFLLERLDEARAQKAEVMEGVLRCRYPVHKDINPSGYGWDTSRLNEVIADLHAVGVEGLKR